MAEIINGKEFALNLRSQIKEEVSQLKEESGLVPGLATVLVGEDAASQVYIRNKNKSCTEAGMKSFHQNLPADTSEDELLELIQSLNQNNEVHGILVQLPLPKHIDENKVIQAIDPSKDVDGFHPINVGNLLIGQDGFRSCTPYGIIKLIESINYDCSGKEAVILGRSNIVGKPMALMLLEKNATVTICHSRTQNLPEKVRSADLLIAAIGKPEFVKGDWIKQGSCIIDVGINRREDGSLCGDVDFEAASKKASSITPVPGGVGPMTIAMLLYNTLQSAKRKQNL